MVRKSDLAYLDEKLSGPILKIEDPRKYSTEDILKSYYREIVLIAGKFTRPNIEKADLVEEGIVGLLDAIERWDPDKAKGNPRNFHNLAIVRIKNFMYNFFLRNSGKYKFPSHVARGINYLGQVRKAVEDSGFSGDVNAVLMEWENGDFEEWATEDVREKVKEKKLKIKNLAKSINKNYPATVESIMEAERKIEQYEQELIEEIYSPEDIAANREFLQSLLASLQPETRDIINMSLEGKTLEEIGEAKGKTRQRIQQIRTKFLEVLQNTRMFRSSFEE